MNTPTDDLTRMLRGAADDIVERERVPGPDARSLWGRGRRATWLARGAAAGLVVALVLVVAAMAVLVRPVPTAVPAESGALTYPEFVSNSFPGTFAAGPTAVFAFVPWTSGTEPTWTVDRQGRQAKVPPAFPEIRGGALSPDGRYVLLHTGALDQRDELGIVDLTDGSTMRPLHTDDVLSSRSTDHAVWSPDSQHVVVDTARGPVALDLFAGPERRPSAEEDGTLAADVCDRFSAQDPTVLAAGWLDADTLLGVGRPGARCGAGLDILERDLGAPEWTKTGEVDLGPGVDQPALDRVAASPDGSRLLLDVTAPAVAGGGSAVLVDARTGERVPFTGASAGRQVAAVTWDECAPVWRGDQPLMASGGLRRPADGTPVIELAREGDYGCMVVAGAELTGSPDPNTAARWRARVWQVLLPVGGVLALVGAVWLGVALRRSRRHGERFLPMIYVQRF